MNRFRLPLLMLTLTVVWSLNPLSARAAPAEVVQSYVQEVVDGGRVPGISAVVLHDGEPVSTAAAGTADAGRPMTTTTPMRLESVSKSFTALAVMQLVEAGSISLDDPLVRHLPEFRLADSRYPEITVRQLLTHTSGLTDATVGNLYDDRVRTSQQAVTRLQSAQLATAPGSTAAYHNPNYHLLARLVEMVSGQSFADYLEQHILSPLGMSDTRSVLTAAEDVPGMAQGHLLAYGHPLPVTGPDYFVAGSGGIVSTADDLAAWLRLQSGAEPDPAVISAESLRLMHEPQTTDSYGFGWYTAESAEGPPVRTSHSGAGAGFGAYQGLFTDNGWSVAILINGGAGLTSPDPGVLAQNLLARLDPGIPTLDGPDRAVSTDLILTALAMLTLAPVVIGWLRSGRWAKRRALGSPWLTGLRLLPLLLPIAWFCSLPGLQLLATGRAAPYRLLFCVSPVALSWFGLWALGCLGLLARRLLALGRESRLSRSGWDQPRADGPNGPAAGCRAADAAA